MKIVEEQELLAFMLEQAYKPMTYPELEQHFGITEAPDFKRFLEMLHKLESEGRILRTRKDRYGVPERMNLLRGKLNAHARGFAFLIPDDREHPDVYLHANDLKGAMNGDIVLGRVTSVAAGRYEGEIVRIVQRGVEQVVGVFERNGAFGFVLPDDKRINCDIFVAEEHFNGAVTGQKVVARIIVYPQGRAAAQGEITEILGHKDDPGVDILSIIRKHGLAESFPEEVLAEAKKLPDKITDKDWAGEGRKDLRGETIVTIDGDDAKDLDDAVQVKLLPNGNYLLGVHIADVGYYVPEKSQLDREAFNRGCSVYLVDRVIPMLPHSLSNGICSLHPQVDRLTLSCEMEFDAKTGARVSHSIFPSVIHTTERMSYSNVRRILTASPEEPETELKERYAPLLDMFFMMEKLAMRLRDKRLQRGAIDFGFQESKVLVDEDGKPTEIIKRDRSVAEQIIEEFMLAANETVAEHFHWLKVPFLYRIHEDPDQTKLMTFMQFAANFGHTVKGKGNKIHPRALQKLLTEIEGEKEETVISTMLLRSMKQAKYDADCLGHFGLAADFYSHFTSPIRRYPDLVIHRIIREVIAGGGELTEERQEQLAAWMPDVARQSSERERVAVEAERDTDQLKKCEFMLDKVGESFTGIIGSVTSFGMFVELENTVEGLIRLGDMADDYYHFHETHMALVGERTSRIYRIGDEVQIKVSRVDMDEHRIDFVLAGDGGKVSAQDRQLVAALRGDRKGGRGAGGSGSGRRGADLGRGGKRGKPGKGEGAGSERSGSTGAGKRYGGAKQGAPGGKKRRDKGGAAGAPGFGFGKKRGQNAGAAGAGASAGVNAGNPWLAEVPEGGKKKKRRRQDVVPGAHSSSQDRRQNSGKDGSKGDSRAGGRGSRQERLHEVDPSLRTEAAGPKGNISKKSSEVKKDAWGVAIPKRKQGNEQRGSGVTLDLTAKKSRSEKPSRKAKKK